MPLLSYTNRSLLLLVILSGVSGTAQAAPQSQAAPSPQAAPPSSSTTPPKGKVLFERHEPAVPDDTTGTQTPPPATPDANPPDESAGRTGVSSSQKRARTTLRRRVPSTDPDAAAEQTVAPVEPVEGVSSSNAADLMPATAGPIVLTAEDIASAQQVSDADRASVSVAATDLDLHLNAHTGETEGRAQLTVRNDSAAPLKQVPLRVSGALLWESARLAGAPTTLPLQQYRLADDLDHTGFASELAVTLPEPLAPGAALSLDLYYGGTIAASAQRLLALGAPAGRAALTDWDTVTDTFTGLRGMGSVLWYPVAGSPAMLRDGSAVTHAVEAGRTHDATSRFRLRLTLEYSGARPDAAFFCGDRQALVPLAATSDVAREGGVVTAEWTRDKLGRQTPSLFIAGGAPQVVGGGLLRVVTDRADTAAALGEAAARVRPMLAEWLGAAPMRPLDVIDLPVPGAAGFTDGSLLVAPLTTAPAAALAPSLVQPLAEAWLPAQIAAPWLRDGVPAFLQAVWAERTQGRAAALASLAATSGALHAQAAAPEAAISSSQPADTPAATGLPLANCTDAACTRGKGAYVFEMLRGMLGDAGLQQAISGWAVQGEHAPRRTSAEETAALEALLQRVAGAKDLTWFFRNWIDADHGLPELNIVTVAPRRVERSSPVNYLPQARKPVAGPIGAEPVAPTDPRDMSERDAAADAALHGGGNGPAPGSWLVAVEVQNNGSADAEVPVTVRSGGLTNTLPLRVAAHSRATIRVPFEAEPQEVLVNDGSVPEARNAQHRRTIANLPAAR